ncbi:MAG TPA: hypothetical protein EYQ24_09610 [Bacteroidetes bacterium]|nr:hypothetical protein [Bacteroidota bacterium]
MIRSTRLLAVLLLAATATAASAQPGTLQVNETQAGVPGFFYLVRPGDATVTVTAIGNVGATGRYVLSAGTTLADLLALSGGVAPDRRGQAIVRVYRDGTRAMEMQAASLYGDGAMPVVLREGDVVEVVGLTSSVPGYYVHTEPGNDPFAVTAAGAFAAPGRYLVDPGTSLGDLVALAGGVGAFGARDARDEVTATVRLLREGAPVFEAPLEDLYARDTQSLLAGDVVDLQVTYRRNEPFWRDALAVITTALGVAILVERLAN